jgi:hypothetical protein
MIPHISHWEVSTALPRLEMEKATESDWAYLLASCEFLLDPRRLTVALSRAKRKMILVASRIDGAFVLQEDALESIYNPREAHFRVHRIKGLGRGLREGSVWSRKDSHGHPVVHLG